MGDCRPYNEHGGGYHQMTLLQNMWKGYSERLCVSKPYAGSIFKIELN